MAERNARVSRTMMGHDGERAGIMAEGCQKLDGLEREAVDVLF
jgi:hypothetical protein